MPQFQIIFSSVVDVYIEENDMEQAERIASNFDTSELDWASNVAIESIEEVKE